MVKKLFDMCVERIGSNLNNITQVGNFLAPLHKEMILERIVNHDMLIPDYLPHVTYHLFSNSLRKVCLHRCIQVTDNLLKQLGKSGCQLTNLTVHGCDNVTDLGIMHVTRGQNELEILELRKLSGLTGKGLTEIRSPALKKLDLRGCVNVLPQGVMDVVSNNPTIKQLILVSCNQIKDPVFPLIARKLNTNLEELNIADQHTLSDASLISLAEFCPNLKSLNIHGCNRVTEDGLSKLFSNCPSLRDLDIAYVNSIVKRPSAECLFSLPAGLTQLSLCGLLINDNELFVSLMCRLTFLKEIRLCGIPAANDDTLEKVLSVIGGNLTHLDLNGSITSTLTDQGLKAITKHCTNLEMLGISLMRKITGITLLPMFRDPARASSITDLYLSVQQLNPDILYAVSRFCTGLEKIDLSGLLFIDDEILFVFAENCPNLHSVYLKSCKEVTDRGVCELARCCPLKFLVLSGLRSITDKSIFALANSCPYLEDVFLNGCSNISPVAVRYLMDCCIHRVFVQHKIPNIDPNQLMAKNLDTGEFCRADLLDI